jgi:integrase
MRRRNLRHVKVTKAKGKEYYYFRTGKMDDRGREILAPLPPLSDIAGFGTAYAAALGARTKRETQAAELSVTDLCRLYEVSQEFRRLAQGSQRLYGFGLAHFRSRLPTAPAGLLERKDIARLIDEKGATPGAANSLLRTINAMFKWARERGHVTNDPCKDIREIDLGEHEPWPRHVLDAALQADDDTTRLAVHLLYYTALRIGDALALRWSDIRDGALYVTPQKTKRSRREMKIPVHRELAAELARHTPKGIKVLSGASGKPPSQDALRYRLKTFAESHGAKVVPHGLRKNAVNALLEAGCSVAETAAISGQSLAMVEHYARGRAQGDLASAAILRWEKNRR